MKVQTAGCVRQRISALMEWAITMSLRSDSLCDRLGPVLGKQNEVVSHMRALPHRNVAAAIARVRASNAAKVVKLAFASSWPWRWRGAARYAVHYGTRWTRRPPSVDRSGAADEGEPRAPDPAIAGVLRTSWTRRGRSALAPALSCSRSATGRCSTRR